MAEFNQANPAMRVVLGGTTVHNFASFCDEMRLSTMRRSGGGTGAAEASESAASAGRCGWCVCRRAGAGSMHGWSLVPFVLAFGRGRCRWPPPLSYRHGSRPGELEERNRWPRTEEGPSAHVSPCGIDFHTLRGKLPRESIARDTAATTPSPNPLRYNAAVLLLHTTLAHVCPSGKKGTHQCVAGSPGTPATATRSPSATPPKIEPSTITDPDRITTRQAPVRPGSAVYAATEACLPTHAVSVSSRNSLWMAWMATSVIAPPPPPSPSPQRHTGAS